MFLTIERYKVSSLHKNEAKQILLASSFLKCNLSELEGVTVLLRDKME